MITYAALKGGGVGNIKYKEKECSKLTKEFDEVYCTDCGKAIKQKAEVCIHCGVRQRSAKPVTDKNRWAAVALAWFLGGFGVHKFYLGQRTQGIWMLLFFWTLIPACIAFVEAILLVFMSDQTFAEKFSSTAKPN